MKTVSVAALTLALATSQAVQAKDQALAFISCPIVRDTSSVPCWLAEFDGQLYYMGIQTDVSADFNPPSLGHKVLVEGTVAANGQEICGGKVLDPVKVSVLPELSPECNTLLMMEDRYELPFEAPRPPGPSKGRLAFTYAPPPPMPVAPFPEKTFTIQYDFDGKVNFQTPRFLTPALDYARHVHARRIEITGYRTSVALSDNRVVSEREQMGTIRAQQVADLLRGAGLTDPEYSVRGVDDAAAGGPEQRRVTIRIIPGG
ncbi:MAG: hypothetical protein WA842_03870 [Croceibacterium sp.]